jgi:hypothetical protein
MEWQEEKKDENQEVDYLKSWTFIKESIFGLQTIGIWFNGCNIKGLDWMSGWIERLLESTRKIYVGIQD